MKFEETTFIQEVTTLRDEDGNIVDAIQLMDEQVLVITGDVVTLYANMKDLQEGDEEVERPQIQL